MTITAREAALRALIAYRRKRAWPDLALGGLIDRSGVSKRNTALARQIVGGVMQNMALCDYYISQFSSIDLKKIEPCVLDILRLSVYQLLFLSGIPHSAAVNEGVELAVKYSNSRAAGFANAVLRKIAGASENNCLPEITGETERCLSIRYSHPEWLIHSLCKMLGANDAEALLKSHNATDTPVTAQVNTLIANTNDVLSMLEADGVKAMRREWPDDCIDIRGTGRIDRLKAFMNGCIYIQDTAARLAITAAGPEPGNLVIDGCAAPGGKSFAAAIAMQNKGKIIACDINAVKLSRVEENASRLGIGIITTALRDALSMDISLEGGADIVLADVPCSGFGVIRKKPEVRYKTESEIAGLPAVQRELLSALSGYVKPGGILLYSTCTILQSENEAVIEWFLDSHGGFRAEPFSLPVIGDVEDGMITLWPHIHGTDGFFICKMKRLV